jgi:hypothetical protein
MIFRSFIGVLKNIFPKKKYFCVFEQQLISDAGQGICRSPIGGLRGAGRDFPFAAPTNTL